MPKNGNGTSNSVLPDILTIKEAAQYLRCHSSTLYRMTRDRQIPYFRMGGGLRFTRQNLEKFINGATVHVQ